MQVHSFDTSDAEKYGVIEATILYNIKFWIEKNKANEKHFYDNKYWTYNSIAAFKELFPYLSIRQLRTALDKLQKMGAIVVGNYNTSKLNQTKWYALNCENIIENDRMHLSNLTTPFVNSDKSSNILTDINTDTTVQTQFEQLWKIYPKKQSKAQALKSFKKLKVDETLLATILQAVSVQSSAESWKKDNFKYVPLLSTWLNNKRWEDEILSTVSTMTINKFAGIK